MRCHRLILGAALVAAVPAVAQTPPSPSPPGTLVPQRGLTPPLDKLPPPGNGERPPAAPRPPDGPIPGRDQPPPAKPISPDQAPTAAPPAVPQRFDNASLALRREHGQWQLWAGSLLLKDFGQSQGEAYEALQLLRDLRVNMRGSIGGVFEYWLTDGQAPATIARKRQVIPFDPRTLRAESLAGNWVLRDDRVILYNFGPSQAEAQQALAVCRQYGFNQLGVVGSPMPLLKYLIRDPNAPASARATQGSVVPVSALMQATEAPHLRLTVPGVGDIGDRLLLGSGRLDLRREGGEWVLYAGRLPLGHFGQSERYARATAEALEQFRVTELCRVGSSEFGFFLSNGRAPRGGSIVGLSAKPLRADRLGVRQTAAGWAVCEDARPLLTFGDRADDARHALEAIKHFGFDYDVPVGGGRLGNVHLFVKER